MVWHAYHSVEKLVIIINKYYVCNMGSKHPHTVFIVYDMGVGVGALVARRDHHNRYALLV